MSRGPVRCSVCNLSSDNSKNYHHQSHDLMNRDQQRAWHRSIAFALDEVMENSIVCSECYEHLADARRLWESYEEEDEDVYFPTG